MLDISKACAPARYGYASDADKKHPRFAEYQTHRAGMSRLSVDCADFKDWLYQAEQNEYRDSWGDHPDYPNFLKWMVENQGGARKCPAGAFPENFKFWLTGGRW